MRHMTRTPAQDAAQALADRVRDTYMRVQAMQYPAELIALEDAIYEGADDDTLIELTRALEQA